MWNASSDLLSATVRVQVSDAYNSTDWTMQGEINTKFNGYIK